MTPPTILALSGSTRKDSLNQKILALAVAAIEQTGQPVTVLNLNDYPLPFYNGDEEAAHGLPENAKKLKNLLSSAQGLLIASPEYNSAYPALLKNMIDWTSRAEGDEVPMHVYKKLKVALISASPSGYGGVRGLTALRQLFENCDVTVIPETASIAKAHTLFDEAGNCTDPATLNTLQQVGKAFVTALTPILIA